MGGSTALVNGTFSASFLGVTTLVLLAPPQTSSLYIDPANSWGTPHGPVSARWSRYVRTSASAPPYSQAELGKNQDPAIEKIQGKPCWELLWNTSWDGTSTFNLSNCGILAPLTPTGASTFWSLQQRPISVVFPISGTTGTRTNAWCCIFQ